MKDKKILVVDDEIRMRKLIKDFLKQKNYEVIEASDGLQAMEIFKQERLNIQLLILDVMMPNMNGWEVAKAVRKISRVPIIMLTAKGEEEDELNGFALGVDEYISKPFSPKILVARVQAILSRINGEEKKVEDYAGIRLIPNERRVFVDDKEVEFSFKEYELLSYLIKNQGIALSRDKILNNVWQYDYYGDSRTIDSHIKKIRQKLEKKGRYIKTIRGLGYKLDIKEGL
ncbi:MAG: response regulator transcription factor [Clostridia bacterium]|nr:response regulator transcription factor [Clostridia bacterium]